MGSTKGRRWAVLRGRRWAVLRGGGGQTYWEEVGSTERGGGGQYEGEEVGCTEAVFPKESECFSNRALMNN